MRQRVGRGSFSFILQPKKSYSTLQESSEFDVGSIYRKTMNQKNNVFSKKSKGFTILESLIILFTLLILSWVIIALVKHRFKPVGTPKVPAVIKVEQPEPEMEQPVFEMEQPESRLPGFRLPDLE